MTTIYKVGDPVKLIPTDEYIGGPVQERHIAKYGRGPYTVEEVQDLTTTWGERAAEQAKHPQLVVICGGERFSGYWLEPASLS